MNAYMPGLLKVQFPVQSARESESQAVPACTEVGPGPGRVKTTLWALPPAASLKLTVPPAAIVAMVAVAAGVQSQKSSPAVKLAVVRRPDLRGRGPREGQSAPLRCQGGQIKQ